MIFDFAMVAVGVCAFLITLYAVPYLYELQKDSRFAKLFEVISTAVRAAEQTIREKGKGADKKIRVMDAVKQYVEYNKIKISDARISDLIEAVVYEMNQEAK